MSFLAKDVARRVVIDQVSPSIDDRSNPFKRVINWVAFTHAFTDSHDLIQVELRIRK